MNPITYEGWQITTLLASRGIGAVMADPWGNTFHRPTIYWHSHRLARRYTQKFIDYYIQIGDLYSENRVSLNNQFIYNESAAQD